MSLQVPYTTDKLYIKIYQRIEMYYWFEFICVLNIAKLESFPFHFYSTTSKYSFPDICSNSIIYVPSAPFIRWMPNIRYIPCYIQVCKFDSILNICLLKTRNLLEDFCCVGINQVYLGPDNFVYNFRYFILDPKEHF